MQNGPFDVVMASDVLEHTPSPAALLTLMRLAVKPTGTILISVPNIAHWSVRLKLLFGNFDYEPVGIMDATHLRWFTAKTITELVESTGLTIIEFRHSSGVDLPIYTRNFFGRLPYKPKAFII